MDILKNHGDAVKLVHELQHALEESVKLQSHYANLLNMHDGGQRIQFSNADDWMARLRELQHN